MFIQSTILIVLLFAIDFFLRKRVRAVFRCFLWLLVLAKLLLIINVASPVGIETWINKLRPTQIKRQTIFANSFLPTIEQNKKFALSKIHHEREGKQDVVINKKEFSSSTESSVEISPMAAVKESAVTVQTQPLNKLPPLNWQGYVFLSWCIGILVFVVLLIQRLFFIKGLISQTKNAAPETQNLFEECCKTMKLNTNKIKLKISSNMVSPAVCGLFRPSILLPDYLLNKLDHQQLRAVLLHELSHIKRYDLPINFLQTALQIIYFYNPFVWFANNIIRKVREQAVDEAVLVALGNEASGYSNILIDIAEMAFFRPALGLRLIGVVESKKALLQRIKHILNRPMPKTVKLGFTSVLSLIIVAALVLPMAKAEVEKPRHTQGANAQRSNVYYHVQSKITNPKSKILPGLQKKINDARDGDIIIVPEGVYTGNITITKPITLKGKNAKKSVIEFSGDVPAIYIKKVKGVNIENLTVRWSQKSTDKRLENPAAIAVRDANVVIKSCLLEPIDRPTKTPYGLFVQGRSDVTFTRGKTKGFAYTIMFTDGANGTVSDSFLEGAGHSVVSLHADSKVAITRNILAKCGYHAVRNTGGTMDMRNNLIIDNNRAGAYLGNRSAHGIIENNLFTRNRGAIWAYASSNVKIVNNLFINSKNAAIGFQASCKLKIDKNSFVDNPTALIRYEGKWKSSSRGATIGENHYYKNKKDHVDLVGNKIEIILSGDPKFKDPEQGDFSLKKSSVLGSKGNVIAGLTNPEIIRTLWKAYTKNPNLKQFQSEPEKTPDKIVKFVRLVIALNEITFEGIKTTWEKLPNLLEKIPDRKNTVFELAQEYNYNNEGDFVNAFGKAVRLSRKFNFKHISNIGYKMLGSKGTVQYKGKLQFDKKIPIELITGTANQLDTLKTQWIKFKQSKDGLVAELNFEAKKNPETRWKIRVFIHNGEKYQEKDIIYNTKNNTENLFYVFDNKNLHADEFQISIEQFPVPLEQVSIVSIFTIKSVDGTKTNIIDVLSQPQVTVLMGMKAEIVVGSENPFKGSKKEFSGLKAEFLPKKVNGFVTLNGKLSITDKTKTKADSEISWNSKKGTETNFKIEKVIPGKEYIISPVSYNENNFLEIKLKMKISRGRSSVVGNWQSSKIEGIGLKSTNSISMTLTADGITDTITINQDGSQDRQVSEYVIEGDKILFPGYMGAIEYTYKVTGDELTLTDKDTKLIFRRKTNKLKD